MGAPKKAVSFTVLTSTVGILLVLLVAESFLPVPLADGHPVFRLFHLVILILLVVSLNLLRVMGKRHRASLESDCIREMTEMRREVEKSAWRYKCLLEGAGNAIFVFNRDTGALEEANRQATELFGYSCEEMSHLNGKQLVAEEERDKMSSLVIKVMRRGRARYDGLKFMRRNGSHFYGDIDARVIELGDGGVVHLIVRDTSFKYRAEREIRQRNQELSILINFMARANESLDLHTVLDVTLRETIEVLGADGGLLHLLEENGEHVSLAATHQISVDLQETVQRCSFSPENPCFIVETQHCHSVEELDATPCTLGKLAAAEGWCSAAAAPLLAQNRLIGIMHIMSRSKRRFTEKELNLFRTIGSQIGIVIEHARIFEELNNKTEEVLRSYQLLEKSSHQLAVSQRKLNKNLALLSHTNQEMDRLDKMKTQFLGMISHEFRTPLTSIISGADFLLDTMGSLSREEQDMLRMIHQGGCRLNEIVTDLLRVIRLEARKTEVNRTTLHLMDLMEVMQEQFEPLLMDRRQLLTLDGLSELPFFHGDKEYLEQILVKLLENAIKFSRDGGNIVVAGRVVNQSALRNKEDAITIFNAPFYLNMGNKWFLQVEVRDSGVGIEQAEQLKIFEKFYEIGEIRHHSSSKHKFQGKGSGLGLAVVKGVVEAHGGMVWVESPSCTGDGTSFFILLPLEEGLQQASFPFMREEGPPSETELGW